MWSALNAAANTVFGPWFRLLGAFPPAVQVCVTALPVTLFALLVFRFASSQSGIRAAKDGIKAHLLELWLFKDDPGVLLRAQGQVVVSSLEYLGHSLAPLLLMVVPVGLLVAQLEARFAFRPLAGGEAAIVTATFAVPEAAAAAALLASTGSTGVVVETPALRTADGRQALWRVRGATAGTHVLQAGGVPVEVVVGPPGPALAAATYGPGDWRLAGYPAARPLEAGPLLALEVEYPRARGEFLGLSSASWLLMGATLVLGFALRGAVGVTF